MKDTELPLITEFDVSSYLKKKKRTKQHKYLQKCRFAEMTLAT